MFRWTYEIFFQFEIGINWNCWKTKSCVESLKDLTLGFNYSTFNTLLLAEITIFVHPETSVTPRKWST